MPGRDAARTFLRPLLSRNRPPAGRIAVVTDEPGWHGCRLAEAFERRGMGCAWVSLADCRLECAGPRRVFLPGFEERGPAGVFVRGISGDSLERIVFGLNVLYALEEEGVRVCNAPRAIERTVDKAQSSLLLERAGLPVPPTWTCASPERARAICRRELEAGRRLVGKPLFGSQGQGMRLLERMEDLPGQETGWPPGGIYYLQRYIEPTGDEHCDIRVLVVGGRACAAMQRRAASWITNRAQGGRCEPCPLDVRLRELAEAVVRALDVDYAGVDLIAGPGGDLLILEANGIPAWQGLQRVCQIDIADRLAGLLAGGEASDVSVPVPVPRGRTR